MSLRRWGSPGGAGLPADGKAECLREHGAFQTQLKVGILMGQSLHVHVVGDKVGKVGQTDAKDAGYHVMCTLSFEQWRTIEDFNKQCCRQTSDQGPH